MTTRWPRLVRPRTRPRSSKTRPAPPRAVFREGERRLRLPERSAPLGDLRPPRPRSGRADLPDRSPRLPQHPDVLQCRDAETDPRPVQLRARPNAVTCSSARRRRCSAIEPVHRRRSPSAHLHQGRRRRPPTGRGVGAARRRRRRDARGRSAFARPRRGAPPDGGGRRRREGRAGQRKRPAPSSGSGSRTWARHCRTSSCRTGRSSCGPSWPTHWPRAGRWSARACAGPTTTGAPST